MIRLIFLGIISAFLLWLYADAIIAMIGLLKEFNASASTAPPVITEGTQTVLTSVGGMISALIISILAITPPTQSPAKTLIASIQPSSPVAPLRVSQLAENATKVITYAYLIVWLACGIAAVTVVFGSGYPKEIPALTAVAKSWFGLAVAAAYAFFGLKP